MAEGKRKSDTTKNNLETSVYNLEGKAIRKMVLPPAIFAVGSHPQLVAQAVRVYMANQRAGTHSVKSRGEVSGSTRKIYRQKGTGRARHGNMKAPIFTRGGQAHGPTPQDYSLNLPKQMRRLALFSTLSDKLASGNIRVVTGIESIEAKTREMAATLTHLQLLGKKKDTKRTLLIIPHMVENVLRSGRNIPSLTITQANLLNAYDVLSHPQMLLAEKAVAKLTETFLSRKEDKEKPKEKKLVTKDIQITVEKSKTPPKPAKKKQVKAPVKKEKKNPVKKTARRKRSAK